MTDPIYTSGKISGLELWAKMLPANQIAVFFKMQYCKKEVNNEVYFLHADKHRGLPQGDTIMLGECNQECPKYRK